jgi:hypothetical protein
MRLHINDAYHMRTSTASVIKHQTHLNVNFHRDICLSKAPMHARRVPLRVDRVHVIIGGSGLGCGSQNVNKPVNRRFLA